MKYYEDCYEDCGGKLVFKSKTEPRKDDRRRNKKGARLQNKILVQCDKCGRRERVKQ